MDIRDIVEGVLPAEQLLVLNEHKSRRRFNLCSSAPHATESYAAWAKYWAKKAIESHGADRAQYAKRAEANRAAAAVAAAIQETLKKAAAV